MSIKKTLASLVLAGSAIFGGGLNSVRAEMIVGMPHPVLDMNQNPIREAACDIRSDGSYILVYTKPAGIAIIGSRSKDLTSGYWGENYPIGIYSSGADLSLDENTIYYHDFGIYRSRRAGSGWTQTEKIIDGIYHHPQFNGRQIYFQYLYDDIYFSNYDPVSDSFSQPIPTNTINTLEWREQAPWVSRDGKIMIFESNRPGGYGDFDLWYATRESENDGWGNITNLGGNINTGGYDGYARVAEDAGILFFGRESGLMQAEIIQIPEPSTLGLLALGGIGLLNKRRRD